MKNVRAVISKIIDQMIREFKFLKRKINEFYIVINFPDPPVDLRSGSSSFFLSVLSITILNIAVIKNNRHDLWQLMRISRSLFSLKNLN